MDAPRFVQAALNCDNISAFKAVHEDEGTPERRMERRYDLSLPVSAHLPIEQVPGPFGRPTRDDSDCSSSRDSMRQPPNFSCAGLRRIFGHPRLSICFRARTACSES
jgi:hypothetical protein